MEILLDCPIKRLCRNNPKRRFCHSERSEESYGINVYKVEILRLLPQNDIVTQSPSRAMTETRKLKRF
jgi:hypothetical protein